jgi:methylglutaconyl-CoA hydratase
MGSWKTIKISKEGPVGTITLNRPRVHHAMNIEMVRDLSTAFSAFSDDPALSIVLLRSDGPNFCAGADLKWMKEGLNQTEAQLMEESAELAELFRLMHEFPGIVVASVQGRAMGGAVGLIAASDLVIAENSASFTFSEVKLGLVPATIAPYVIRKTGQGRAAGWMLSGRPFNAVDAREAGLVHFLCDEGSLEEETKSLVRDLKSNGPGAMKGIKEMLRGFPFQEDPGKTGLESAEIIARFRISPEGQEGMNAFFEKRKPYWNAGH